MPALIFTILPYTGKFLYWQYLHQQFYINFQITENAECENGHENAEPTFTFGIPQQMSFFHSSFAHQESLSEVRWLLLIYLAYCLTIILVGLSYNNKKSYIQSLRLLHLSSVKRTLIS